MSKYKHILASKSAEDVNVYNPKKTTTTSIASSNEPHIDSMGLHSNRSQHVLQIENIIRFDNSAGNNNCWLNCVVRVLAHMLHAVPNLHMYQKSTNVMIDGFLQYLKNIITMKKGGLLCVDDMTVHVPGLHHLLSVKSLFSTLIHDSDFASRMQQDASEALTRILDVFQEENTTVAPFSFCEYDFFLSPYMQALS